MLLQVILNIICGSGMQTVFGSVVALQVILNIMYGSQMEVPLSSVKGSSEHCTLLRNGV
jgi:hypothetical protein